MGTTRHEIGHAIDYLMGGGRWNYYSADAVYGEVWARERDAVNALIALNRRDVAAGRENPRGLSEYQASLLAHYLGPTGQMESWAELFGVLYGGSPGHEITELMRTHFPRSLRLVQEAVERHYLRPRR